MVEAPTESEANVVEEDMFWNYKNYEFFFDAILSISNVFEKNGDGLGFYILNKIMLPIFHGLKHSNYSNSIHRYENTVQTFDFGSFLTFWGPNRIFWAT